MSLEDIAKALKIDIDARDLGARERSIREVCKICKSINWRK